MELEGMKFNEALGLMDSIINELKGYGKRTEAREFIEAGKRRVRAFADKYGTQSLTKKDMETVFRFFGNSINEVHAFLKLLRGELVVKTVGTSEIELREKGINPGFELPTLKFVYRED